MTHPVGDGDIVPGHRAGQQRQQRTPTGAAEAGVVRVQNKLQRGEVAGPGRGRGRSRGRLGLPPPAHHEQHAAVQRIQVLQAAGQGRGPGPGRGRGWSGGTQVRVENRTGQDKSRRSDYLCLPGMRS